MDLGNCNVSEAKNITTNNIISYVNGVYAKTRPNMFVWMSQHAFCVTKPSSLTGYVEVSQLSFGRKRDLSVSLDAGASRRQALFASAKDCQPLPRVDPPKDKPAVWPDTSSPLQ